MLNVNVLYFSRKYQIDLVFLLSEHKPVLRRRKQFQSSSLEICICPGLVLHF